MFTRLLLVAALLASCAAAQVAPRGRTQLNRALAGVIRDEAKGALRVIAPGAVTIQGVAGTQLTYTLQVHWSGGAVPPALLVLWERQGGVLTIQVPSPSNEARYELQVNVPRQFGPVAVEALSGDITAYDLEVPLQVRAGGGQVKVSRVRSIEAESWGGEVRLGQINGAARIRAGGGNLTVERVRGEAWLETGGGDVLVRRVDGALHASTGAGNIQVESVGGLAELRTAGGRIEIGEAGGAVTAENHGGVIAVGRAPRSECVSVAGAIRLRETSAMQAETAIGSISAELPAHAAFRGGLLRTGQGDITLLIPSTLSVTVVARTAATSKKGSIASEFPGLRLERRGTAGAGWNLGLVKVNGGGPVLQVETAAGAVYLRKQE